MTTTFYVCKCGNPQSNHQFRHPFENTVKVIRIRNKDKKTEQFVLDAHDFSTLTKTKCSILGCSALASLHETPVIGHVYTPEEIQYRDIKFSLPESAICKICGVSIKIHESILTHPFTTHVIIENKTERDAVEITHPEDDEIKIIWQ